MTGSTPFSIEESEFFKRSLKKLVKASGKNLAKKLISLLANSLENLLEEPYPRNSRKEPLPKKTKLPGDWTFHKLELKLAKGASGQIRRLIKCLGMLELNLMNRVEAIFQSFFKFDE